MRQIDAIAATLIMEMIVRETGADEMPFQIDQRVPAPASLRTSALLPTAVKRSPETANASTTLFFASAVKTLPLM